MGGFSILHLILVLVIVLVFFGPSRLPGLGKSLGEAIRGFKKGMDGDEIDVTRRDNLNAGNQAQNEQKAADGKDKPQT
jgi:sec-independent protein translocase protein TatA